MLISLAALLGLAASVAAADEPPAPATQPVSAETLAERQGAIRERVLRLENTLQQLAQVLGTSEPDKAERLQGALDEGGKRQIRRRLDELVARLKTAQLADAEQEQTRLVSDLEAMLLTLTDTRNELDRLRAERERLEQARTATRVLRENQLRLLERNQRMSAEQRLAAAMKEQADALEQVAREQQKLRNEGAKQSPWNEQLTEQKRLQERAQQAAEAVRRAAEPSPSSAAEDAAHQAEQAGEQMQSARDALEKKQRDAADSAQQQAEEQLRRAIQRLREESERLQDRERVRELETGQRGAQSQAEQIEKQMQPQGGKSGQEQTPGQAPLQQAREQMQRAADRLGEDQPDQAQPPQESAAEKLQEALDELDDALRQVRKEEMEEFLASLESRFKALLTQEEAIRASIGALDAKGSVNWVRTDHLQLAEQARTQWKLAEEAGAIARLLIDEGTTVMIPDLVRQLEQDLGGAAKRLDAADAGPQTQALVDDGIAMLREILDAVEMQRKDLQENGAPEGQQEGGGEPAREALLPGSAELKLLKSAQVRLNRRTEALQSRPDAKDAAADFAETARRQRELADVSHKMNERK